MDDDSFRFDLVTSVNSQLHPLGRQMRNQQRDEIASVHENSLHCPLHPRAEITLQCTVIPRPDEGFPYSKVNSVVHRSTELECCSGLLSMAGSDSILEIHNTM